MERILLLEDDDALGRGVAMALAGPERAVERAATLAEAGERLAANRFDLLILDVNLPDGSGLTLLRQLRSGGDGTPVILLTANDLELDEVTGLEWKPEPMTILQSPFLWRCCGPGSMPSCGGAVPPPPLW